jgi:hypothetical protein
MIARVFVKTCPKLATNRFLTTMSKKYFLGDSQNCFHTSFNNLISYDILLPIVPYHEWGADVIDYLCVVKVYIY